MPFLNESERKALHDTVVEEMESHMPLMNEEQPAECEDSVPDG